MKAWAAINAKGKVAKTLVDEGNSEDVYCIFSSKEIAKREVLEEDGDSLARVEISIIREEAKSD